MTENEEQQGEGFDFQRYLNIARRRHMQFLVPAFFGWLVVWGASWFLDVRYKSGTLILVEQPTMPKNYVVPNVNDDLQDRLQSIEEQILSRTRLLTIIDKLHLYEDGGGRALTPDEKVAEMRSDIKLELVHDAHGEQITAFRIYYSAGDPHVAQEVASDLTNLFINENLKVRQQESEQTTQFIESQLETARQRLSDQEAKVKAFQAAHEGELPTEQAANLQILSGFQQQFQTEQDALATAKQQRVYYQTLIDQYRNLHVASRTADGAPAGLAAIDQQLDKLNATLADLRSSHTDNYPDVISAKEQIATLTKRRAEVASEIAHKPATVDTSDTISPEEAAANSPLLQLKGQLQASEVEIKNREHAVAQLQGKIGDYSARVNLAPAAEQQLADLTRGYTQSQADYDDLVKKKNESEIAERAEQAQQGEHFRRLDPANLPQKPDFPNRLKFCGMGLGVGIALGLAIVVALEFFDDRMYSEKEIKALLPAAVLSEIPQVMSAADERKAKKKILLGWATTAAFIVTILAGATFSYLRN